MEWEGGRHDGAEGGNKGDSGKSNLFRKPCVMGLKRDRAQSQRRRPFCTCRFCVCISWLLGKWGLGGGLVGGGGIEMRCVFALV